jgi:tetratricopeptide (TPR) repeat protein
VRVQLRHRSRDAALLVTVRPATSEWSFDTRANKTEVEEITRDLTAQYAKVSNVRPLPGSWWGSPVYRLDGVRVTDFGEAQQEKALVEVRFRRFGLEYAVSLVVGKADQGTLLPRAEELLQVFSFLPPVSEHDGTFIDFSRGYALARPGPDWQLLTQPFHEEEPVKAVFDGGRAEVAVQLTKGKQSPTDMVQELITSRRSASPYFEIKDQGKGERDGIEVANFSFEDFRENGRKRMAYKGFAAVIGEQGLLFVARSPITDSDARKLQSDAERALAGVRLLDTAGLAGVALQAQNALSLLSQGWTSYANKRHPEAISQLDEALGLVPTYARALYIRALAKKGAGDFAGFRADLEQASQLDPEGGYDTVLGPSYAEESEAEAKTKNWARAADLRLKAWRATKDDKHQAPWLTCLRGLWTDGFVKDKQFDKGLKDIEPRVKDLLEKPAVLDFWKKTVAEGVTNLTREGDFGKAKLWVRKLKRLDNDPKAKLEADNLLKAINEAEARKKGGR